MRGKVIRWLIFGILLICQLSVCLATNTPDANDSSKYLNAVREFVNNVLKYGKDVYGSKHTPLFVDGLNIHTHEPVKWISKDGEKWVLSNLASQQNLFRTLDGLTKITGDPKYRQAAVDAIEYAFANLRHPNGLLYWGMGIAYDAQADRRCGSKLHCLKCNYPYYELMWEVNPSATKQFIEAFWSAHILDWSNLDMDRIGYFHNVLEEPWNHEYKGDPVFFESKVRRAGSLIHTGSDLIYAAAILFKLSGEERPLFWARQLGHRYVETRHPKTGICGRVYNLGGPTWPPYQLRDHFKEHFVDVRTRLFPGNPFASSYHHWSGKPDVQPWICQFLLGKMLGADGKEFTQWALQELTAWGKVAYRQKDNSFIPMLTDGTSLESYVCKKDGVFGPKGTVAKACPANPLFFWAYSLAYNATGDKFMWEMARDICLGNDFGSIGESPASEPMLHEDTNCSNPYAALAFLELHEKTGKKAFLGAAQRIGDNILHNRFHKGFFVPSKQHINTRFDAFEPLALLHLHAAAKSKLGLLPRIWPSRSYFECAYGARECETDIYLIYTLTDLPVPPRELQEAAAVGDIDEVKSLISKGTNVDAREYGFLKTALHRASMNGHRQVVEQLLINGANINAGDDSAATALHYAAEQDHIKVAELLIAKGADVNAKNSAADTPLHWAVRAGHKDIVELLIANGADINAKDKWDYQPIHVAAHHDRTDVVELLISKGADINAKTSLEQTPIQLAQQRRNTKTVELLRKPR